MKYIEPKIETLSVTYNDITYSYDYYKPATAITGVTDESYPVWAVGTTYSTGDYVIIDEVKRIFRSTADSNTGNYPLEDTTKWVDYGAINSYRMFASDEDIGSQTTGSDGVLEFDFSQSSAISGLDLDFTSSQVTLIRTDTITYLGDYDAGTTYSTDERVFYENKLYKALQSTTGDQPDISSSYWEEDTDNVFFNEQILGSDIGCSTYGEYFYTSANKLTRKILTDLDWLPSSILRIGFTGSFKIGTICYNKLEDLGCTIEGSRLTYESSSKIQTNEFTGFRTVLRFGRVRILDCDVIIDNELFGQTIQTADKLIDKNIIWIPSEQDKWTEAISIGYIETMDVPMNNSTKFQTKARIIGVSK
jgi:hypothetical protein